MTVLVPDSLVAEGQRNRLRVVFVVVTVATGSGDRLIRCQFLRQPPTSVGLLGINGLQCLARPTDEAHHRPALEFRLRRRVCPKRSWFVDGDVVPDDAGAIMLSHRVGQHPVSVPVLFDPRIVNAPKRDRRRCSQVRS